MDSAKWKPRVGEKNPIVHKKSNLHDIRAMTGKKTLPGTLAPSIIGDLAKEICRYARYIFGHGAQVCAIVITTYHR